MQLYPSRYIESTSVLHANFLLPYLQKLVNGGPVQNITAICNGGPDWTVKGAINFMVFGKLWRDLGLDSLILTCYAAGHSRFNAIERSLVTLTKWLTGVVLPLAVKENNFAIPRPNEDEKWRLALDNAVEQCARFWDGKILDGCKGAVDRLLSSDAKIEEIKKIPKDIHHFINASRRQIDDSEELQNLQRDYQFYVRHCNRKAYQFEFIRCRRRDCLHCSALPNVKNNFLDVTDIFAGTCPDPVPSDVHFGHYKTFQEALRMQIVKRIAHKNIVNTTDLGCCPHHGCSNAFFSEADKKRHFILMGHQNTRAAKARKKARK